jgi:hypothetical protein
VPDTPLRIEIRKPGSTTPMDLPEPSFNGSSAHFGRVLHSESLRLSRAEARAVARGLVSIDDRLTESLIRELRGRVEVASATRGTRGPSYPREPFQLGQDPRPIVDLTDIALTIGGLTPSPLRVNVRPSATVCREDAGRSRNSKVWIRFRVEEEQSPLDASTNRAITDLFLSMHADLLPVVSSAYQDVLRSWLGTHSKADDPQLRAKQRLHVYVAGIRGSAWRDAIHAAVRNLDNQDDLETDLLSQVVSCSFPTPSTVNKRLRAENASWVRCSVSPELAVGRIVRNHSGIWIAALSPFVEYPREIHTDSDEFSWIQRAVAACLVESFAEEY